MAKEITNHEAKISEKDRLSIEISNLARELLEEISFAARVSEFIDAKSGVSARLSISAMENLVASAKLRLVESEAKNTQIRYPSIQF